MTDSENCIFCRIARGEIPSQIVYQDADALAFHDIAPKAPTHILIIPRQHIVNVAEVDSTTAPLMGKLVQIAAQVAREQGIAESGYRLVTNSGREGGQEVMHLHFHLLGGRRLNWPPG